MCLRPHTLQEYHMMIPEGNMRGERERGREGGREGGKMEEENKRREEALAARAALQPNLRSSGVSQDQLKKLQELRKRRLEIKQRSMIQKNPKGVTSGVAKACEKERSINSAQDQHEASMIEDSSISTAKATSSMVADTTSMQKDEVAQSFGPKKRKLFWGLDTKERWERKANM